MMVISMARLRIPHKTNKLGELPPKSKYPPAPEAPKISGASQEDSENKEVPEEASESRRVVARYVKSKLPTRQDILDRRARKNAQSRARAAKLRERIEIIQVKAEESVPKKKSSCSPLMSTDESGRTIVRATVPLSERWRWNASSQSRSDRVPRWRRSFLKLPLQPKRPRTREIADAAIAISWPNLPIATSKAKWRILRLSPGLKLQSNSKTSISGGR